jgi:RNA polymerase sigma-70 factor (ECF subfamily)
MREQRQPDLSDEELILLYQHDNRAAGAMLFERYEGPLLGYLRRMLGDGSEAEEVLQEVFLKVHENRCQYAGHGKFSSWIYQIATNACRDRATRRRGRPEGHVIWLDGDASRNSERLAAEAWNTQQNPREAAYEAELRERIERAILGLPQPYRTVFLLRQRAGLGYEEISSILGVPENRLRVQFHRARRMLFDEVKTELPDSEEA